MMDEFEYVLVTNGFNKYDYLLNNDVEEWELLDLKYDRFNKLNFKFYFEDIVTKDANVGLSPNPNNSFIYKADSLYKLIYEYIFTVQFNRYDHENLVKSITYQSFIEDRIQVLFAKHFVFKRDRISDSFSIVKDIEMNRTIRKVLEDNANDKLKIKILPSTTECYEMFVKSINDVLDKFNTGTVTILELDTISFKKVDNKIIFGTTPEENTKFKKKFRSIVYQVNPISYALRITTDSKFNDNIMFVEYYSMDIGIVDIGQQDFEFQLKGIEIENLKISTLEADRKLKTNVADYTVFCDIKGKKELL
jgi:hypothetical protein